jgi:hypothetical protein
MKDIFDDKEQRKLAQFMSSFIDPATVRRPLARRYNRIEPYTPGFSEAALNGSKSPKDPGSKITIVTDATPSDRSLNNMIAAFAASSKSAVETINLNELNMVSGCLECYRCAEAGACAIADDVEKTYRSKIMAGDGFIMAPRIEGRFLSGKFKEFVDRSFFNGHRRFPKSMQMGFIVSGPLRALPDVRGWCEVLSQMSQGSSLAPVVTDEDSAETIQANLTEMARQVDEAIRLGMSKPALFPAVGGHMILRDLVYEARFLFREDYRYYKSHGLFDYPQNKIGNNIANAIIYSLMSVPGVRKVFEQNIAKGQLAPAGDAYLQPVIITVSSR